MRRQIPGLIAVAMAALLWGGGCTQRQSSPPAPDASSQPAAYQIESSVAGPVTVGATSQLEAKVVAGKGYHLNADYPVNFRPGESTEGIAFEHARYPLETAERLPCRDHADESCELRARIPFTAVKAGPQRVAGVLAFSVCNPQTCLIEKVPVEVPVDVR